jgi:pimeloyl-ACP methyl ester carboxylesterase
MRSSNKPLLYSAIVLALGLTLSACKQADNASATNTNKNQFQPLQYGALSFAPCSLKGGGRLDNVDAQCTDFEVPENYAAPNGRKIKLRVAWIPASGAAENDPVFMIAGGPGQSALKSYPLVAAAFSDVNRSRNVLLVDARGTGGSNPLLCLDEKGQAGFTDGDADETSIEAIQKAADFAERCQQRLSKNNDLRFFTTSDHIQDLDAVRKAVGAERVNLVGISYGTRVAQQYAKRYPQQTRSLVLDSVAPNPLILGNEHARNLENVLDIQFQRCASNKVCEKNLGAARANLSKVREQLQRGDVAAVRYRDPRSGEWKNEKPSFGHLAILLRLYAYSPEAVSTLPYLLNEAAAGRYEALLAQSNSLMSGLGDEIYHGMQLSVSCSEDADGFVENAEDENTVMGNSLVTFAKAQCAVWPKAERPKDSREPLTGTTPVLILSGEFDPVTPPRYGDAVLNALTDLNNPKSGKKPGLPNARHLVLKGQGHSVLQIGCMPKLFAQYIESADAKKLDAKCLDRLSANPPFSGIYGWEP